MNLGETLLDRTDGSGGENKKSLHEEHLLADCIPLWTILDQLHNAARKPNDKAALYKEINIIYHI